MKINLHSFYNSFYIFITERYALKKIYLFHNTDDTFIAFNITSKLKEIHFSFSPKKDNLHTNEHFIASDSIYIENENNLSEGKSAFVKQYFIIHD